eukprot:7184093-Prymnesium_polylepis.1
MAALPHAPAASSTVRGTPAIHASPHALSVHHCASGQPGIVQREQALDPVKGGERDRGVHWNAREARRKAAEERDGPALAQQVTCRQQHRRLSSRHLQACLHDIRRRNECCRHRTGDGPADQVHRVYLAQQRLHECVHLPFDHQVRQISHERRAVTRP